MSLWKNLELHYGSRVRQVSHILFPVALEAFQNRLDIIVPFKYTWESKGTISMSISGINHHVYFLAEDLPKEIMKQLD